MNMYLNLEYTKQRPKTWFSRHEFRKCAPHGKTKAGSLSERSLQRRVSRSCCSSQSKGPEARGHFRDTAWCCSTAARSPIPTCTRWRRSPSLACFCRAVTAAVSDFWYMRLRCCCVFEDIQKLGPLQECSFISAVSKICSKYFKGQMRGCSKGEIYWGATRKSSVWLRTYTRRAYLQRRSWRHQVLFLLW